MELSEDVLKEVGRFGSRWVGLLVLILFSLGRAFEESGSSPVEDTLPAGGEILVGGVFERGNVGRFFFFFEIWNIVLIGLKILKGWNSFGLGLRRYRNRYVNGFRFGLVGDFEV